MLTVAVYFVVIAALWRVLDDNTALAASIIVFYFEYRSNTLEVITKYEIANEGRASWFHLLTLRLALNDWFRGKLPDDTWSEQTQRAAADIKEAQNDKALLRSLGQSGLPIPFWVWDGFIWPGLGVLALLGLTVGGAYFGTWLRSAM